MQGTKTDKSIDETKEHYYPLCRWIRGWCTSPIGCICPANDPNIFSCSSSLSRNCQYFDTKCNQYL